MGWARRRASEIPRMERRVFRDARGRRWAGLLTSGTAPGGEEHAEVVFVCLDQPDELKRVGRLDVPPARAADVWRHASPEEVLAVFERSEPA